MRCDWRPKNPAFIDFETQSMHELKGSTAHKYVSDETTTVLTCVVQIGDEVHRMGPYLQPHDREKLISIASQHTLVAHNAPFDALVWDKVAKLPEATWCDTLPMARAAGYPGKLDDLGKLIEGRGKDENGKKLIDMLCKIRGRVPAVGPAHDLLMEYNVRDVALLKTIFERVKDFGEPAVMTVDRTINERGVPIDRAALMNLIDLYDQNEQLLGDQFQEATGITSPKSAKQVKDWMKGQGFRVPEIKGIETLQKAAFKEFMDDPGKFYIGDGDEDAAVEAMVHALQMRREIVRVGKGKAHACLGGLEDDDRIRDQFVIYGAGPGRYAGRNFQMHNMPHAVKEADVKSLYLPTYADVAAEAMAATEKHRKKNPDSKTVYGPIDILNAMLRHLVRAPSLVVADWNAVEARMVAYLSDCHRMLEKFADPHKSVYLDMGRSVFGRDITKADQQEYIISKTLVLGCTYGMSGAKFGYTCKSRGVRTDALERMGLSPADAVKAFRQLYPEIPALWKAYHDAVHLAVKGTSTEAGKCFFGMVGNDLHIVLPSGRPIVYRNARIEQRVPGYQKLYGMAESPVPTVVYDSSRFRGIGDGFLYGSKVCENVSQGACADLLKDKQVDMESAGYPIPFHVHDEIAAEHDNLKGFCEIMSTPPTWAPDFPLMVEGYCGPIWTKQADGFEQCEALMGRVL